MKTIISPFKFLDAYQQADGDVFFGRGAETENLYNALSGVKHLLVYGLSGAGKTSLIECGLRNQFSDVDWFALTIRRGNNLNASVFAGINQALTQKIMLHPETGMPVNPETEFSEAVEQLFAEKFQPVYLLFDQFEELLISGETEEQQQFFKLLYKLVRYKLPCRVLLVMREEFIGYLSEFDPLFPGIFQHRFRVEKMSRKTVATVITQILEAPQYRSWFTVNGSSELAEAILAKLPDKKREIELAHVQVFLQQLWERAVNMCNNGLLPVLSKQLVKDSDHLDAVLERFLKKQLFELDGHYGENIPLEVLAQMITERNTKLPVSAFTVEQALAQKNIYPQQPVAELLAELEKRRIVRTLKTDGETQYEISHDVLAVIVGEALTEEMKLREKAAGVYRLYDERPGLLSQEDIDFLRPFQTALACSPELQHRIEKSTAAIKQQREQELLNTRRRLRTVYSLLGAAILALLVAGYFGYDARKQANIARQALTDFKKEQEQKERALLGEEKARSAKEEKDFFELEGRVNRVLEGEGCPADLLRQMDSLFKVHRFYSVADSTKWSATIKQLNTQNNYCP
ncbi:MAG: ATP-binding protein [Dinghuibacter sp.]|nr:ATP-binding protein [Dinghuibacter sp.]